MASSGPPAIPPSHGFLGRLAREGQINGASLLPPSPGYQNATRPSVTAGTFTVLLSTNTAIGRARFMLEAFIGADQACAVAFQQGQSQFPAAVQQTTSAFVLFGANGGTHRWNFQGSLLVPEFSSFTLGYTNPTTSGAFTAGGMTWVDVTADFNFAAPYVILFIGDSITYSVNAGTNGTTNMNGNNGFPFIIRNHLLNKGVPVRIVNKGVSGMTSLMGLVRLNDNSFYHCVEETDRVALIIDAMGMNDAQTPATSQADINAYQNGLLSLLDYYPNAELIAMSHTGTNDVAGGRVANSGTIRGYKQSWVNSLSAPYASRVHFADGTLAYGGTGGAGQSTAADGSINAGTYLAEVSNQIHPNIAGHAAIVANVLGPAIANTNWGRQPGLKSVW